MGQAFKQGEKVILKSGGPPMTVKGPGETTGWISCTWFDGSGNKHEEDFHPDTIRTVEE